uniref:Uncharacterized protein n=1 Tax=Rhizophora mucronata TaxID=61149 RepID=A0A2P2R191_RHIMU
MPLESGNKGALDYCGNMDWTKTS